MVIGDRLRAVREEKKFSQSDVEKRAGLLPGYIFRLENGLTVPAIETLERLALALECPLYQLFYEGEEPPPKLEYLSHRKTSEDIVSGSANRDGASCRGCDGQWARTRDGDRRLLQALRKMTPFKKRR
jgi:transcriptional regulator with XRE-family HTH domain